MTPRHTVLGLLILCLGLTLTGTAIAQQKLYRWVDDKGQVYYSDKVPPEYADKEQAILNDQGLKIDAIEGAKTPEQLKEEQRLAEIAAAKQKIKDEEIARNRMLLNTFPNEDDLIMARDGKIAAIDAGIRTAKARIQSLKTGLDNLRSSAADMERNGRAVPDKLYADIKATQQQIADNNSYILAKQAEQDALRASYETDLARYRALKGSGSLEANTSSTPNGSPDTDKPDTPQDTTPSN